MESMAFVYGKEIPELVPTKLILSMGGDFSTKSMV